MSQIDHRGTLSSNGIQTTGSDNIIDFKVTNPTDDVNSLAFTAEGNDIHIKINDEICTHLIKSDCTLILDKVKITKITIVESGVSYSYDALYI